MSKMTMQQAELWEKIKDFKIDDSGSSFTFTDRLMRENDWSLEFAIRAVFEYKRFMFLICATDSPKTPSDEVDQVWHLHLIYTQSYWEDFCQNTLGRSIHHGPTRGSEQKSLFKNTYLDTLETYRELFEEEAPQDLWPPEEKRFGSLRFTRINRSNYWVIPKIKITKK